MPCSFHSKLLKTKGRISINLVTRESAHLHRYLTPPSAAYHERSINTIFAAVALALVVQARAGVDGL